jgi:hypothetical protein
MRPDVYAGAPPKGMEAVAVRPDRVFLAPPVGERGTTAPLPIRGICLLREGETLRSDPAQPLEVVKDIWHLGFRMPTAEGRSESFRHVTRLATTVPVWNVQRPMKLELLSDTVELIASLSRR